MSNSKELRHSLKKSPESKKIIILEGKNSFQHLNSSKKNIDISKNTMFEQNVSDYKHMVDNNQKVTSDTPRRFSEYLKKNENIYGNYKNLLINLNLIYNEYKSNLNWNINFLKFVKEINLTFTNELFPEAINIECEVVLCETIFWIMYIKNHIETNNVPFQRLVNLFNQCCKYELSNYDLIYRFFQEEISKFPKIIIQTHITLNQKYKEKSQLSPHEIDPIHYIFLLDHPEYLIEGHLNQFFESKKAFEPNSNILINSGNMNLDKKIGFCRANSSHINKNGFFTDSELFLNDIDTKNKKRNIKFENLNMLSEMDIALNITSFYKQSFFLKKGQLFNYKTKRKRKSFKENLFDHISLVKSSNRNEIDINIVNELEQKTDKQIVEINYRDINISNLNYLDLYEDMKTNNLYNNEVNLSTSKNLFENTGENQKEKELSLILKNIEINISSKSIRKFESESLKNCNENNLTFSNNIKKNNEQITQTDFNEILLFDLLNSKKNKTISTFDNQNIDKIYFQQNFKNKVSNLNNFQSGINEIKPNDFDKHKDFSGKIENLNSSSIKTKNYLINYDHDDHLPERDTFHQIEESKNTNFKSKRFSKRNSKKNEIYLHLFQERNKGTDNILHKNYKALMKSSRKIYDRNRKNIVVEINNNHSEFVNTRNNSKNKIRRSRTSHLK